MVLNVVGTGSKGNCYILEGENSALVIECGMPLMELKKATNFNLGKIAGCIISHHHGDHCKYFDDFVSLMPVYASQETLVKQNTYHIRNFRIMTNKSTNFIGEFKVIPFYVEHDAEGTLGFLINHHECGNVLFVTDTYYLNYKFPGLNNIIIEANYSDEIIDEKSRNNKFGKFIRDRVIQSHVSLENCISVLSKSDLSEVNNIVLIHLSDSNSDERMFKDRVEKSTGKKTTIATTGMNPIPFNKAEF